MARFLAPFSQIQRQSPAGERNAGRIPVVSGNHGTSLVGCVLALMLAMFSAASLMAQGATGSISGHVADPTGAVVPGATITLTNPATNTTRSTVSTGSGDYTFASVPIGTYVLKAEHAGFKTASSQQVTLQVAQSMTQNFTLQVGGVEQTVTVTSSGDLLQTQDTSLGTVVPQQTLAQMPVNSRNYLDLVAVSANTNTVSPSP